jgi:uncharacterized protein (DUF58 family)
VSEHDRRQALADGERIGAGYALTAPRRARATTQGARVGARAGGSLEFRDYRDYEPGDDVRTIDWNLAARSDRLVVKQYHEETAPALDLIVDGSRSMALTPAKLRATLGVAAMVAAAAANAGFPARTWLARERLVPVGRGSTPPSQWDDMVCDFAGTPVEALARAGSLFRPLSLRVVVSDFLWPVDPDPFLRSLAAEASRVVLVRILAAEDAAPDVRGAWQVIDCETGEWREVVFDSGAATRYGAALERHEELWRVAARNVGAAVVRAVAEEIAETLVFEELLAADVMRLAWSR